MLLNSCSHIHYLRSTETVIMDKNLLNRTEWERRKCSVCMCLCVLGGYMVVCIVQEYAGQVEPIGFATVLGFLLVSKHLVEVCHRAHRQTCACTHAQTTIVCFIGAHRCHGNPISSARGKMQCAKKMPW